MEQIYFYLGLVVFWLIATIGIVIVVGFLFAQIFNEIGRWFTNAWIIVDYARHRKKFKTWLKEKGK